MISLLGLRDMRRIEIYLRYLWSVSTDRFDVLLVININCSKNVMNEDVDDDDDDDDDNDDGVILLTNDVTTLIYSVPSKWKFCNRSRIFMRRENTLIQMQYLKNCLKQKVQ